jgi:type IX secretion system PorP/SprF family membrane protein
MKKNFKLFKITVLILMIITVSKNARAQDPHFSQYDASPVVFNPGLTGMQETDGVNVYSQLRTQWGSMARGLTATVFSLDLPYDQQWGFGAYLLNDNEAELLNAFSMVFSGAYRITDPNQKKMRMSVGLQLGFIYKSIKKNELLFDQQYNSTSGTFDPDLPSGETFIRYHKMMPEVNFGYNYTSTDYSKTLNPYAGIAVFHVTNPKESFISSVYYSRLPFRFVLNGGTKIAINTEVFLDPNLLIMRQGKASEYNFGLRTNYFNTASEYAINGGINYRWKDAVIPFVGFLYKNVTYQISYDINTSTLKTYSRSRGGVEFFISFSPMSKKKFGKSFHF